jgi:RNA polymerase sigma-70 factor (ECF subfamily)
VFLAAFTSSGPREVSPDATLLSRLLQRDVSAFEQLYDRHSRLVYGLVLRILQQASTSEEVVQDVFLQLWRNAGQYDSSRGPFVPWLCTMARNRALDQLRLKSERQRRREDQPEELPSVVVAPDYEKAFDEKRRAERVRVLMASLTPQQKKAIELAYFEGLSHSEIAARLKEPLGTVKSWIRNGLLRLKEGLQATT